MKLLNFENIRTKIIIGLVLIAVLSQLPFVINRWQTARLYSKIRDLSKNPHVTKPTQYNDYKGVIHAHSFLGGHSTGSFDEMIAASGANGLDFVVVTEHTNHLFDTSAMTLRDFHSNTLYIGGNEISVNDGNRFLVLDGFPELAKLERLNTPEFLREVHNRNRIAFVTYPERFKGWETEVDGSEVFSLYTNAKSMNKVMFALDMIWSFRAFPDLTMAKYFRRPDSVLKEYDRVTKSKRLTLFAGSDAHSNLGLHLGDDSNNKFFNLKVDRYETIFRLVRTHVLIPRAAKLQKDNLLRALKAGNSYIGLDILGDSSGFMFSAFKDGEVHIMGDELIFEDAVDLSAQAPKTGRFVIFLDGEKVFESGQTTQIRYTARRKGAYRVEVYQDILGSPFESMPWIISNPIYLR